MIFLMVLFFIELCILDPHACLSYKEIDKKLNIIYLDCVCLQDRR